MALSDYKHETFVNTMTIREETSEYTGLEIGQLATTPFRENIGDLLLTKVGGEGNIGIRLSELPKLIEYLQGVLKEHNETKN